MTKEETYELIESYLDGKLNKESKAAFEDALAKDAGLKSEFEIHKDLHQELSDNSLQDFRQKLKDADKQLTTEGLERKEGPAKVLSFKKYKWLGLAASVAALIFCLQYFESPSNANSDLFAANFETYRMVLNQRSTDNSSELNQAIKFYEAEAFENAAQSFSVLNNKENNISYQFYEAVSLLASDNPEKAKMQFNSILLEKNHLFKEQSEWFLVLANLRLDQAHESKRLLKQLPVSHYKYQEAQTLLKKLRPFSRNYKN